MAIAAEITPIGIALALTGGVGAVLLGYLLRRQHDRARVPKLTLRADRRLTRGKVGSHPAAYARLDVSNDPRRDAATDVRIVIERVREASGAEIGFLARWQLAWANEDHGDPNVPPVAKTIHPGGRQGIDLVHVNRSVARKLIVDVRPQPNDGGYHLGAGTFTLELVVSGENAPARRYAIDVVHKGVDWDGDPATADECLRVENLRPI
jgi:hypothetical protein